MLIEVKNTKLKIFIIYLLILIAYILLKAHAVAVIDTFASISFPLWAVYIKNIFLDGWLVSSSIVGTLPSPANAALIYPPLVYYVVNIFTSIDSILVFSFFIQLIAVLLIFNLFSIVNSLLTRLAIAVFSASYFVTPNWFAPDFVIQPIMVMAVILIAKYRMDYKNILIVGILTSLIIITKHNIGVFFAILCSVVIFFDSITIQIKSKVEKAFIILAFLSFLLFGFIFMSKILYFDEFVFYLFPYFSFVALVAYVFATKKYGLDIFLFIKRMSIYLVFTLTLPLLVFWMVGSKFGYANYWHSLFGMGLEYLYIWDHGIVGIFNINMNYESFVTIFRSLIKAHLFVAPLMVNIAVIAFVVYKIRKDELTLPDIKILSIGIMAIFMFFPLEGYHILSSKLFIFLFVLMYMFCKSILFKKLFIIYMIAMIFVALSYSTIKYIEIYKNEYSFGSQAIKNAIGLGMKKELAKELDSQVSTIYRSVPDNRYYTVDGTLGTLIGLSAITKNKFSQFYMLMGNSILKEAETEEIINEMGKTEYVLTRKLDYDKYILGQSQDIYMAKIMKHIQDNYEIIDEYNKPINASKVLEQVHSFYIFRAKNGQ